MKATIISEKKHFPVLLNELISIISPLYGGTFIDCTFGQGGYSKEILKFKKNKVIAFDRDIDVKKYAEKLKKKFPNKFIFKNIRFSSLNKDVIDNNDIKAIIFDLGLSSLQIHDYKRGISFKSKSKLNMKMGLNNFSADDVINKMNYEDLNKIIKYFGEESKSRIISKLIIKNRTIKPLDTQSLVSIIDRAKIKTSKRKINNATKTFQGIRMFVNNEVSELVYGLVNSFKVLPVGGIIAVVTFHSIEDKIVKYFFKHYSEKNKYSRYVPDKDEKKILFNLVDKKPIYPSVKEIKINPSSRSAKLRYAIKVSHNSDFTNFFDKFKFYLNLEKLSNKL